ncbi:hypothetical protein BGZ75_000323 [Mortierella antarctica]|nr:hypothetical protein BGZ75_000323 [Mortierella antarctica]
MTWYFEMTDYSPGHYDVVLGISTKHLRIDMIESIMFSISTNFKEFGPSEVFSRADLEQLSSEPQSKVVKCKLHHQLQKNLILPKVIMMEVRTAAGVSSSSDAGFLELHFMELRASRPEGYLDVSVSWDGAYVALGDASAMAADPKLEAQFKSVFSIYSLVNKKVSSVGQHSARATLEPSNAYQHCSGLVNFRGYGKFHVATATGQEVDNELFVTCNNSSVDIYRIHGKWKLLRTFAVDEPRDNPRFNIPSSWRLIKSLKGRFCVWVPSSDYEIMVWDIELGSMVSFSLWQQTYSLKSVLDKVAAISDIQFIDGDTRIIVNANTQDQAFGQGVVGFILDTVKMSLVETFSIPGDYVATHRPSVTGEGQQLYSASATTLDLISLPTRILRPFSAPHPESKAPCDDHCQSNLTALSKQPTTINSAGLKYSVKLSSPSRRKLEHDIELPSVLLSISNGQKEQDRMLTIPVIRDPFDEWEDRTRLHIDPWKYKTAVLLEGCSQLVVASRFLLMVWGLPTTLDGNLTLLLAWCLRRDNGDFSYTKDGIWNVCPHQRLFGRRRYFVVAEDMFYDEVVMQPRVDMAPRCDYGSSFQKALVILIDNFMTADESCRDAILRYIASHQYSKTDGTMESVLSLICRAWKPDAHESYKQAVAAILDSSGRSWALTQHAPHIPNPFQILLAKARDQPRITDLTSAFIQYCFQRTDLEKDPHHIRPIIRGLHELLDQKNSHTPLATWTLPKFAYIPAKSRRLVLEYHTIAHPPDLWRSFWSMSPRSLEDCQEPTVVSSAYSLLTIVWRRCTFQSKAVVKLHDFKPEMLENPAIVALIEYKWNTIGFQYWAVRFFCQCCFYLLVLTTVSLYNAVDMAVFGLPLAGSINQLMIAAGHISGDTPEQGNAGLYSFSVLFIFLHFLFELRVSSRVCQFVTIIIRIISEIRLFFIIFAGGILAFAIATLHIIHSCPFESCVEPATSFSSNFYFATTSTYFFMP